MIIHAPASCSKAWGAHCFNSVLTHNASVTVPGLLRDVCGFILCSGYCVLV